MMLMEMKYPFIISKASQEKYLTLKLKTNGVIRGDRMIKLYERLEKMDEKVLLLAIVGSLEAIQKNAMTIDEAEIFLFSPRMVSNLKQKKCNENIISLIERGCELEDIESLIPEDLHEEITNMIEDALKLLKKYELFGSTFLNFPSANGRILHE